MKVSIIGAGAWGTALGLVADRAGSQVALWARDGHLLESIAHTRRHPGLPDVAMSPSLAVVPDLATACQAEVVILAVSAQAYREVGRMMAPHVQPETLVVVAAKGVERESGALMTEVLAEVLPGRSVAVLSGPNFAHEVAQGLPAASVLACSPEDWVTLKDVLSYSHFRLYHSLDTVGVQLSGALKNVVAIACGLLKSQRLGENAMAALICRSLAEIRRMGLSMGAQPQTFAGLSGMGDLMLTCLGTQSRNLKFGEGLGQDPSRHGQLLQTLKTVEGMETAKSVRLLAEKYKVEMPLCEAVYRVLYEGADIQETTRMLLSRPLKAEMEKIG